MLVIRAVSCFLQLLLSPYLPSEHDDIGITTKKGSRTISPTFLGKGPKRKPTQHQWHYTRYLHAGMCIKFAENVNKMEKHITLCIVMDGIPRVILNISALFNIVKCTMAQQGKLRL